MCSGIYAIKTHDNHILYIGKADNILKRMAQHRTAINFPEGKEYKYGVINDIEKLSSQVHFEILEHVEGVEKLGYAEGWFIRRYMPPLNYQIPKEENWREFDTNQEALEITAEDVIQRFKYYDCLRYDIKHA